MKKKVCIILVVLFCALAFVGCNHTDLQGLKDRLEEKNTIAGNSLEVGSVAVFYEKGFEYYCHPYSRNSLDEREFEIPNKMPNIKYIYEEDKNLVFGNVGLLGFEYIPKKDRLIIYEMTPDCFEVVITQENSANGIYYTIKEKKYNKIVINNVKYDHKEGSTVWFFMEKEAWMEMFGDK